MADGYTEADLRLVAEAIAPEFPAAADDPNYRDDAGRVLAALAGAGRLTPEDTRRQAVIDAAVRWRAMRAGTPTKPKPESAALIAAVDALGREPSRGYVNS